MDSIDDNNLPLRFTITFSKIRTREILLIDFASKLEWESLDGRMGGVIKLSEGIQLKEESIKLNLWLKNKNATSERSRCFRIYL